MAQQLCSLTDNGHYHAFDLGESVKQAEAMYPEIKAEYDRGRDILKQVANDPNFAGASLEVVAAEVLRRFKIKQQRLDNAASLNNGSGYNR
ncbi:hypothetical protein [Helicobacter suis]|uniref:hypothetical protein n=1 Tax=Helicobacter suis TaxID=104628 RepID=UPI0013D6ECA3|nr:hypothetical protein [Helicobacter suis]